MAEATAVKAEEATNGSDEPSLGATTEPDASPPRSQLLVPGTAPGMAGQLCGGSHIPPASRGLTHDH